MLAISNNQHELACQLYSAVTESRQKLHAFRSPARNSRLQSFELIPNDHEEGRCLATEEDGKFLSSRTGYSTSYANTVPRPVTFQFLQQSARKSLSHPLDSLGRRSSSNL